jgi:hypothetical protein
MGVASFGYRHPPYDLPAYLMNVQPDDPDRGLDLPALERSALERSVRWLKESFEKSGIILDRPLQV